MGQKSEELTPHAGEMQADLVIKKNAEQMQQRTAAAAIGTLPAEPMHDSVPFLMCPDFALGRRHFHPARSQLKLRTSQSSDFVVPRRSLDVG
jgi:hypothetical protein